MSVESPEALERSVLESKDREQLLAIASALGVKATSRAKKADIIDRILEQTGGPTRQPALGADDGHGRGADGNGGRRRPRPATRRPTPPSAVAEPSTAPAEPVADAAPAERGRRPTASRVGRRRGAPPTVRRSRWPSGSSPSAPTPTPTADRPRRGDATRSTERSPARPTAADGDGRAPGRRPRAASGQGEQPPPPPPQPRPQPRRRAPGRRPRPAEGRAPPSRTEQSSQAEPVEVAGYLDLRDEGYGFLRVNGYLPSRDDVYVSVKQTRQYGLRKGDHVTGASRPAGRNEKNPALLRIDTVNGVDPEQARQRPRFEDLTPLFPDEKLRLENPADPTNMTARIIDLVVADREGPARPHRVAAEGRQDHRS